MEELRFRRLLPRVAALHLTKRKSSESAEVSPFLPPFSLAPKLELSSLSFFHLHLDSQVNAKLLYITPRTRLSILFSFSANFKHSSLGLYYF
jgi:hypothetical protein